MLPMDFMSPVAEPPHFVGRSAQIEQCRDVIERKGCISIVGEPHSGLTSLLLRLASDGFRRACEEHCGPLRVVLVDSAEHPEPLSLVRLLLSAITPDQARSLPNNWRRAFGKLVRALAGDRDARVVILFDDFEHIGASEAFVDFLDSLRGLVPREDMSLVTTTHTELFRCCHSDVVASPFPNLFQVSYMDALAADEASELVSLVASLAGQNLEPYRGAILDLGGRQPYFLKMACGIYVRAISDGRGAEEEARASEFDEMARTDFACMWRRLSRAEREALRRVTSSESDGVNTELARRGYIVDGQPFSEAFRRFVIAQA